MATGLAWEFGVESDNFGNKFAKFQRYLIGAPTKCIFPRFETMREATCDASRMRRPHGPCCGRGGLLVCYHYGIP